MDLVSVVREAYSSDKAKNIPSFRSGDTVAVHARITEGSKSRIQIFQGTVIAVKARGKLEGHFRVRKISSGIGVERVFPFHSPNVEKVEVISKGRARQSKLFYLRDRAGKSARIDQDFSSQKQ